MLAENQNRLGHDFSCSPRKCCPVRDKGTKDVLSGLGGGVRSASMCLGSTLSTRSLKLAAGLYCHSFCAIYGHSLVKLLIYDGTPVGILVLHGCW